MDHPCVLVRLTRIRLDALRDLVVGAHRFVNIQMQRKSHGGSRRSEGGISFLNKPRTPFSRQYGEPFRRGTHPRDFVIPRFRLRDYVRVLG